MNIALHLWEATALLLGELWPRQDTFCRNGSKTLQNPLIIPQGWLLFPAVYWVQKAIWNVWNKIFGSRQLWPFLGEFINISGEGYSFQKVNSFKENNDSGVILNNLLLKIEQRLDKEIWLLFTVFRASVSSLFPRGSKSTELIGRALRVNR